LKLYRETQQALLPQKANLDIYTTFQSVINGAVCFPLFKKNK
jgi:hypothetical protein